MTDRERGLLEALEIANTILEAIEKEHRGERIDVS
jgi:hypothetical protein